MGKQDPSFCCNQKTRLNIEHTHYLRVKDYENIFQAKRSKKQHGRVILISKKLTFDFKSKLIRRDRDAHYLFIKEKFTVMIFQF